LAFLRVTSPFNPVNLGNPDAEVGVSGTDALPSFEHRLSSRPEVTSHMSMMLTRVLLTGSLSITLLAGSGAAPAAQPSQTPAAAPPPSPVQIAHQQERERIMKLLGMEAIPPGAVSSSPETYDESRANPYPSLPDPLMFRNGEPVKTPAQWQKRRAEIVEEFEREVYGRRPQNIPRVTWSVVGTEEGVSGGVATRTKQLAGRVDNSEHPALAVTIQATLTTPASSQHAVPVIIVLGGANFPLPDGMTATPNPCVPPGGFGARGAGAGRGAVPPGGGRGSAGPQGPAWQEQVLARGWGYASLNTGSVQGDCAAGLTSGIIGLVNKGQPRALDDWGALSAWGWGASRLLDYFETDPAVHARRVGVQGHSRFGKAALLGMALDERIAIGYIASSGHGGAKLHRRKYGETIENVANTYYYWMAGNYLKYAGRWDALPVDSHQLIALCAPRPVFLSGGNGPGPVDADGTVPVNDAWIDPRGSFLAAVGAGPVYRLLGVRDLGATEFPPIDTPIIEGHVGFHQHTGGHTPAPTWPTFLTFAARHFGDAGGPAPRSGGAR
jgi:hypothetical protein